MSAIAAIFNRDGTPVARDDIERVTNALAPFGRDFRRSARFGEAALGCALATFTAEDAGKTQPVSGGSGRYRMVFDGRIDNREHVAAALGLGRDVASLLSEAELAMRSFERWGENALNEWVADFALILWDEAERKLLLARDPFGRLGLLYHETPRRFVAATMPLGLHALPDIPREFDELRIADSLSQIMTETRRTYFRDILSVPAGTIVTVTRGRVTSRRYYDIRERAAPVRLRRDEDYVEAARELLDTAVRARLRTNRKVGAFMSGGLDSSTGAVVASRMLEAEGKRLPVFTWVPQDDWDGIVEPGVYGDETPYVREIAARFPNLDLTLVPAKGRTFYHRQDEYLRLSGLPMRNCSMMGWFHTLLEEARSAGIGVMLSGEMGNMTLSHAGHGIFYDHWRSGRLISLAAELWRKEPGLRGMMREFNRYVLPGILPPALWERLRRLRGVPSMKQRWLRYSPIAPEFGEALDMPQRAFDAGFDYFDRGLDARREFWFWSIERVHCNFGQWLPANHAMHNIDMRDPFSDRRLIEWSLGVPERQYYRNGSPRWLIKRMMRDVLPDTVLDKPYLVGRPNTDWQSRMRPEVSRMKSDLAAMREDADLSRMVDIDRLATLLDNWPEVTATDGRSIDYGQIIPMAMQTARFVQLAKGSNR